ELGVLQLDLPWVRAVGTICRNELWGWWRGLPITVADVIGYHRAGATFAFVRFSRTMPEIVIARRTRLGRFFASAAPEVDVGVDPFHKRIAVRSRDARFATRLVTPQLQGWLLSTDARFAFAMKG